MEHKMDLTKRCIYIFVNYIQPMLQLWYNSFVTFIRNYFTSCDMNLADILQFNIKH